MNLNFDNRFTRELPEDPIRDNSRRQVMGATHSFVAPTPTSAPKLLAYASEVAELIGLTEQDCQSDDFLRIFSGNHTPPIW